jgi:signal transduction histidine kinase
MRKVKSLATQNEVVQLRHLLEQKNRELEIEAALERVRVVAMGMNQPSDMIDVCRIISEQLQILKVENIRNVQTAIINDEKGTYLNYEFFTQYNTTSILEIESKLHPKVLEFVKSIKKSKDAFFSTEFKGKDLEEWIAYRRKTNQNADPILEKAKSVHYYFYSIGPGALGLSTYVPLVSQQLDVFRRFHKVFLLAYKRFMDINQAEAQAREAQIEAALERVRTASMSMHSSTELKEVVQVLYTQLQGLNLSFDVCDIQLRLDDSKDLDFWTGTGDEIYKELIHWPYINIPIFELIYKAWDSGKTIVQSYGPYETQRFLKGIIKTGVVPESRQKFLAKINEMQYIGSYQHHAGVDIIRYNNDSFTQTDKDIVTRFAKAFEQSYVRFLDLQKAEEQTREAQIETALERVRATSLSMRKTSDISKVVEVYFNQLRQLNIDFIQAWINVFHLDKGYFDIWFSPLDGVHKNVTHFQMPSALFEETTIKSWRKGEPFSTLSFNSESEVEAFLKVCDEVTGSKYFSQAQQSYRFDRLELLDANYKYGAVSRTTRDSPTEQHKKIFQRFAKVFEQTYTRFLDLQKAEAQAREAKIEAALERVRSRSMAMHKSEELGEVIEVVFKQMMGLDLPVDHVGFILDYREREDMHIWFASKQVKPSEITIPYFDSPHWNSFRKAKSTGEKFFTNLLDFKTKNKFYKELFKHIPPLPGAATKNIFERPGLVISTALLDKVGLYFENYTQLPFTDDENDLLTRFAYVFEQAYTRFLDLQKAEAQAREAQINLALERVRSAAMAMHGSNELSDTISVLFNQLKTLGINPVNTYLVLYDLENNRFNFRMTGKGGSSIPYEMTLSFDELPQFQGARKDWESEEPVIEVEYAREDRQEWLKLFTPMNKQLPKEERLYKRDFPDGIFNCSGRHAYGSLGITHSRSAREEEKNLLVRFAKEFELVYKRFLDLQKAEAQAREAQIEAALERVRSASMAMHQTDELKQIVDVVFQQLKILKISLDACYIDIFEEDSWDFNLWVGTGTNTYPERVHLPFISHPLFNRAKKARKEQETFYTISFDRKQKDRFVEHLVANHKVKKKRVQVMLEAEGVKMTTAMTTHAALSVYSYQGKVLTPQENEVIKRIAAVFEQAYTRFLDLKKAEAQAREAEIQLALERVRARTMAMQHSNELSEAAFLLAKQVRELGIKAWGCAFHIYADNEEGDYEWFSNEDGYLPFYKTPRKRFFKKFYNMRESGETLYVKAFEGKACENHYKYLLSLPIVGDALKDLQNSGIALPTSQIDHIAYFKYGYLLFITYDPVPEAHKIFKRFAKEFEQTYIRFLDLQKAEAQAREAQIEAALERVRAVSMAMHHSNDLVEAVRRIKKEISDLGIFVDYTQIFTDYTRDPADGLNTWVAVDGMDYLQKVHIPFIDHPVTMSSYMGMAKGLDYVQKFSKSEKNSYFKEIFKYSDLRNLTKERKDSILNYPGWVRANIPLKNSMLQLARYNPDEFSEDEVNIFKRFGKVFEQAYTRFLDLQKAENQAREAQIEAALERVRAKAMAMQHSDDLSKSVTVTLDELEKLELRIQRCGVGIFTEKKTAQLWTTTHIDEKKQAIVLGELPLTTHPMMKGSYDAWRSKRGYEFVLEGENLRSYYDMLRKEGFALPEENIKKAMSVDRQYYHYFTFPAGGLYIFSEEILPEEDSIIVQRFADVFHIAFTRYLDLQSAELRAREAEKQASLDRVRAEIASMRTTKDLERITPLIWKELTALGVPFFRCGIFIIKEDEKMVHAYLSTPEGDALAALHIRFDEKDIGLIKPAIKNWRKQEAYCEEWDQQHFIENMKRFLQRGHIESQQKYQAGDKPPKKLVLQLVPFEQGMLYAGNSEPLDEEHIELMQELADAFSVAYSRYEDFVQLEQAKKNIETALTDLQAAQNQLIHSEKMASLGELTAGIAHEIQNPLNFVNNFSEVSTDLIEELLEEIQEGNLEEVKELTADIMQNLEKINHHGKRASSIVKGMLEHSRSGNPQKEPTDINLLADEYLRLAYHGFRAKDKSFSANYKLDLDESLPKISVISQDIGRVLLNLINNAFFAVSLKAKNGLNDYKPEVMVRTKRRDNMIEIRIKDNGCGIPSHIVDKIFQPFFTTKPTGQGTGLGLSLSYDIVTKGHDGNLEVDTNEGLGTEFIITLKNFRLIA